jgi:hypothetical protein
MSDAHRLGSVLTEVHAHPKDARSTCSTLTDARLRDDCLTAGAAALAPDDPVTAESLCDAVSTTTLRAECWFQLAEGSGAMERCDHAGPFERDCRLHVLPTVLARTVPRSARPGEIERSVAEDLRRHGIPDDLRIAWVTVYRHLLLDDVPLDLAACTATPSPFHHDTCRAGGLLVFDDRLDASRRAGLFPCDGGPFPEDLAYVPDDALSHLVSARRNGDLCQATGAWAAPAMEKVRDFRGPVFAPGARRGGGPRGG